jgi:hypothetical protein
MLRILIISFLFMLLSFYTNAQQTMGLFQNDAAAFNGYTLFQPLANTNIYLIDNCGEQVHSWTTGLTPGNSVYLLENGDILRPCKINNGTFSGGGSGGFLERRDWAGQVLWSYNYSNSLYHQHHDIELLPNGNILVIAWEMMSNADAIAAGRNPLYLNNNLWPDKIVELQPLGVDSAVLVWEWHATDHLVQDFDNTKANYGVVADNPQLINFNFVNGNGTNSDWLHLNGIDYNAALDQIIMSNHNFSEIWIIDHSTTTAQAASDSGGDMGKGGDLLYRWGNPQAYNRGTITDKKLFSQHDAQWIPDSLPDGGKLMVFNNGLNRPAGNNSSIDIINPSVDLSGNYLFATNNTYLPDTLDWTYMDAGNFYSSNISGTQRLGNGNTLICEGNGANGGHFFEVDRSGQKVWDYINPVGLAGPMTQGANPNQNNVFRCYRFAPDYPAFTGRTLSTQGPIEQNPLASNCVITGSATLVDIQLPSFQLHYNSFTVNNPFAWNLKFELFDLTGRLLKSWQNADYSYYHPLENLHSGLYIIRLQSEKNQFSSVYKIIKP